MFYKEKLTPIEQKSIEIFKAQCLIVFKIEEELISNKGQNEIFKDYALNIEQNLISKSNQE